MEVDGVKIFALERLTSLKGHSGRIWTRGTRDTELEWEEEGRL